MAIIAFDGFDHYNSTADLQQRFGQLQWVAAGSCSISATGAGRGGFGKCIESGGAGQILEAALGEAAAKLTVGFAVNFLGAGFQLPVYFIDNITGTTQCSWVINSLNGTITFYNAAGTAVQTALNSIGPNGWFYIEMSVQIGTTTGTAALQVNGQPIASFPALSGINTQASANASASAVLWHNLQISGFYIDDVYFCDGTTGPGSYPANGFLGDVRVATLFPIGNGAVAWTPSDGGSDNWNMVAETAFDGDTTYNRTNTAGAQDLLNFQALAATINQVIGVQATGGYRKEDAGSRTVANVVKSGTTTSVATAKSPDVSWVYFTDLFALDPNTGASWTVSGLNAVQAGYKVVT